MICSSTVNREDWYLIIVFIMVAVSIAIKSYFDPDGHLSHDSTNYLKCAQNLLAGKGYYVSAYHGFIGQDRQFFAIWPAGYPTLIFLFAKLTGFSVFLSSKLLNITLAGTILVIFRALFKKSAYVYALIFLFSAYIEIFSYTWSETIFITALVWFSASIYLFISKPEKPTLLYFSIMMSSLLIFLSRYIGAFSFGLIGLLGLYYGAIMKDRSKSITLIGIAVLNISIMAFYLYHNYTETGFLTGVKRVPSTETNLKLLYVLVKALVAESLIPVEIITKQTIFKAVLVCMAQLSVLGFLLWKYRNNILRTNSKTGLQPVVLSYVFGTIGFMYLFSIVAIRWITQFDGYNYRLISPGSFLIIIAIIYFLQQRASIQFFNAIKNFLFVFAIVSFLLNTPYRVWHSHVNSIPYIETIKALEKKYENVEKDSIVIFGSTHLNYLYEDIRRVSPYYAPTKDQEKWSDFLKRIDHTNNIYISVRTGDYTSHDKYDQSVVDFVEKYDDGTLLSVSQPNMALTEFKSIHIVRQTN